MQMQSKGKKNGNKFKNAVIVTPDVANCFQNGLSALGMYKDRVEAKDTRLIEGSIDIDGCTRLIFPQANRWDYALCYNSEVYFIEVHSAQTSQVSKVLKKLQWLRDWLNEHAPELNKLKPKNKPAFYWIQSNNFQIQSHLPQYRKALNAGLKPIPKLILN